MASSHVFCADAANYEVCRHLSDYRSGHVGQIHCSRMGWLRSIIKKPTATVETVQDSVPRTSASGGSFSRLGFVSKQGGARCFLASGPIPRPLARAASEFFSLILKCKHRKFTQSPLLRLRDLTLVGFPTLNPLEDHPNKQLKHRASTAAASASNLRIAPCVAVQRVNG